MLDLKSFTQAIQQIADEKGISQEKVIEAIEMALAAAYKRDYGKKGQIVRAKMDSETHKVVMRQIKIVVDETMVKSEEEVKAEEEERARKLAEVLESPKSFLPKNKREYEEEEMVDAEEKKVRFNPEKHLMLEEALKINPDAKPGEELGFPLEYHEEYGRIAAQTAKQVIIQRIREVEREAVFEEYKNKEGEVVSGLVQRIEGRNIFIDIGRTVAVLPPEEQIAYERYRVGERLKTLVILVEKNPKGPGVFLSRSHPRLLKKLFEIEVPEIASGAVEIKAVAREPGSRSKVAVTSHETGIDPVGSLVGQKGIRVSTVINELGGEKIDVIEWSEDPGQFVGNSMSPAKVLDVEVNERRRDARVMVPEEQLSLAIGKGGQNVRLAAKLTGWKIDVRSSKSGVVGEAEKEAEAAVADEKRFASPEGLGEVLAEIKQAESVSKEATVESDSIAETDKGVKTEEAKPEKPKKKKMTTKVSKTKKEG